MMVSKRQKKLARVLDFEFVEIICMLSEGPTSSFDGVFCLSVVFVCTALHKLVKSGHLKLKGVVIVFPVPTGTATYRTEMSQMHEAYEKHKKDYTKAYTVAGVRATQPEFRRIKLLFHEAVCKVLEAHAGTMEMLILTLTMPENLEVLRTFLKIVSRCTSVTDMDMDVRGLVHHDSCTVDLVFEVEAVVKDMQKMKNLSWTGFFDKIESTEVLVKQLPPSVESLRLAGNISPAMGTNMRYAMMWKFLANGLPNLKKVDLAGYREQDKSLGQSANLVHKLFDDNSIVERVILPAKWTSRFEACVFDSVGALCGHADRLARTRGKRLTIVISNTDVEMRVAQVQCVRDLVDQHGTTNVVVE